MNRNQVSEALMTAGYRKIKNFYWFYSKEGDIVDCPLGPDVVITLNDKEMTISKTVGTSNYSEKRPYHVYNTYKKLFKEMNITA